MKQQIPFNLTSLLLAIVCLLSIVFFSTVDHPLLGIVPFCLLLLSLLFSIYHKIEYRNSARKNELRFPTENDSYIKSIFITLGSLLTIGSLIWLFNTKEYVILSLLGAAIGLSLLINGLLDIPKGIMRIKEQNLSISANQYANNMSINQLKEIVITDDQIILSNHEKENVRVELLELDAEWKSKIVSFLKTQIDTRNIEIRVQ